MLALGLLIAALAPNARVAGAVGAIVFLPMMFFAGLWTPQATMPALVRQIGGYTPLGAAVHAIQDTMVGRWPQRVGLAVLAGYAVVFGGGVGPVFPVGLRLVALEKGSPDATSRSFWSLTGVSGCSTSIWATFLLKLNRKRDRKQGARPEAETSPRRWTMRRSTRFEV